VSTDADFRKEAGKVLILAIVWFMLGIIGILIAVYIEGKLYVDEVLGMLIASLLGPLVFLFILCDLMAKDVCIWSRKK